MSAELEPAPAWRAPVATRIGEVAGRPVVLDYGNAAAEYAAVRAGVGVADRADLAQIRMFGRDPVRMLHGLVTNDLLQTPEGQGVYAAMLTPKGRAIAELRTFILRPATGTEVLVVLPREALAGTREHLKKFVPPMFARWEDAATSALGVYGPRAPALIERVLGSPPPGPAEDAFSEAAWEARQVLIARTLLAGGEEGFDLFAEAGTVPRLWDALLEQGADLGARPLGFDALETLRIEAGRPRFGRELTEDTIPTEAFEAIGQMPRAVSFTKGCYTGQEVIVRIAHRGHVNRHLRGLLLGDAAPPPYRTPLVDPAAGKEVGWVTSAAVSPRLRQTVALAYARRELEPGAAVRVAGDPELEATLVALPFQR